MSPQLLTFEKTQRKAKLPQIRPGDTVRVHQTIREGNKQRTQIFEGVVLRISRPNELAARIVVRKITSGIGVEKSWLLHSPNLTRVEVVKRTKVRRAYLTYLRARRGKSARLSELGFDRAAANEADTRTAAQIAADEARAKEEAKAAKAAGDQAAAQTDDNAEPSDAESAKTDAADILDDVDTSETDPIESVEVAESTEELAKAENKQAAAADPSNDEDDRTEQGGALADDAQIAAEEAEAGVERAQNKEDREQDRS